MIYQIVSNVAEKVDLFIEDDMTVGEVRAVVAAMIIPGGVEEKTVRLTFQGHHLESQSETWSSILRAFPLPDNAPRKLFVHVSKLTETGTPSIEALRAALPSSTSAQDEEKAARAKAKMMEPLIDCIARNPAVIESMISLQPGLQRVVRNNPEALNMFRNPDVIKSIMMSQLDPDQMRQMNRSMGLQLAQVGAVPGGQQMLERYMAGFYRDLEAGQELEKGPTVGETVVAPPDLTKETNNEALPNPWQRTNKTEQTNNMQPFFSWPMMQQQQIPQQQQLFAVPQNEVNNRSAVPDAVRWAEKIAVMKDMGFDDEALCIEALQAANGDVDTAISIIVQRLQLE